MYPHTAHTHPHILSNDRQCSSFPSLFSVVFPKSNVSKHTVVNKCSILFLFDAAVSTFPDLCCRGSENKSLKDCTSS